jgi:hypothetical protein
MKADRRALLVMGALLALPGKAKAVGKPAIVQRAGGASQGSVCSVAEAIAAHARESNSASEYLDLAYEQCSEALEALQEIQRTDDANQELANDQRYLEGIDELLRTEGTRLFDLKDYAETLKPVIEQCQKTIDLIRTSPTNVSDEEVVELFRRLAAVNLINASAFGFPNPEV